ncbi:MAG: hypothetical protein OTI36_03375 [Beijerinckiaceae bacterium]|nr:hypothetical protein [Beijerinckiaceae bacterium]
MARGGEEARLGAIGRLRDADLVAQLVGQGLGAQPQLHQPLERRRGRDADDAHGDDVDDEQERHRVEQRVLAHRVVNRDRDGGGDEQRQERRHVGTERDHGSGGDAERDEQSDELGREIAVGDEPDRAPAPADALHQREGHEGAAPEPPALASPGIADIGHAQQDMRERAGADERREQAAAPRFGDPEPDEDGTGADRCQRRAEYADRHDAKHLGDRLGARPVVEKRCCGDHD